MQPPHVRPFTVRAGPPQLQASVGSRSPYSCNAAGSAHSFADVLGLAGISELEPFTGQQRSPQRRTMARVDGRARAEVHLRRAAVEAGDTVGPQPRERVGVVAVTQERLRIGLDQGRVQMPDDRDLVLADDRGQHGTDLRVADGERPRQHDPHDGPRGGGQA